MPDPVTIVDGVARSIFTGQDAITARLAARGAKIGADALADRPGDEGVFDDLGLMRRLDITPALKGVGGGTARAEIMAPKRYAEEPELFIHIAGAWTPFMQVGTFFGIENEAGRLLADLALDPTNLVGGIGALTKLGRISRLVSAATSGGAKGKTLGKVLDSVESTVKVAGKMIDDVEYLNRVQTAAREGWSARKFKGLLDEAIKSDKVDDATSELLAVLRKDRDAYVSISENIQKLGAGRELGPELFLQKSLTQQFKTGQRDFVRFDKPFALTRQLLGIGYKDATMWVPAAPGYLFGSVADMVLGNAVPRTISGRVARKLDPSLDASRAVKTIGALAPKVGQVTVDDALYALNMATATMRAPGTANLAIDGIEPSDDAIMGIYSRVFPGDALARGVVNQGGRVDPKKSAAFMKTDDWDLISGRLQDQLRLGRVQKDQLTVNAQDTFFRQLEAQEIERLPGLAERRGLNADEVDAMTAARVEQVRLKRGLMHPSTLVGDSQGLGAGFEARIGTSDMGLANAERAIYDVIEQHFPAKLGIFRSNRQMVDAMSELVGRLEDSRVVWEFVDGDAPGLVKALLRSDDQIKAAGTRAAKGVGKKKPKTVAASINEASPLLRLTLDRYPGLEDFLKTEGIPAPILELFQRMGVIMRDAGKNGVRQHLLGNTLAEYWVHNVRPGKNFKKDGKKFFGDRQVFRERSLMMEAMGDPETVLGNLMAKLEKEAAEKQLTYAKLRELTDIELAAAVRAGVLELERNGIKDFSNYMSGMERGLTANALFYESAKNSPKLTDDLLEHLVTTKANPIAEKMAGQPIIMEPEKVSKELRDGYNFISSSSRTGVATADEAMLKAVSTSGAKRAAFKRDVARQEVAAALAGKTDIDGLSVSLKSERDKVIPIQSDWVIGESVPKSVWRAGEISKKIRQKVRAQEVVVERGLKSLAKETGEKVAKRVSHAEVAVMKGFDGPIVESMRLMDGSGANQKFWRHYDNWNFGIKAFTLTFDVFHANVLAIASMLGDPKGTVGALRAGENAIKRALQRSSLGALAGSGVTAMYGGEGSDILAGGLVGAMWANALAGAVLNATGARAMMGMPGTVQEVKSMAYAGLHWTGRPNDRAIGFIAKKLKSMGDELRKTGNPLTSPLTGGAHVLEAFDEFLWSNLHNGSKMAYFHAKFTEVEAALEAAGKLGKKFVGPFDKELVDASKEIMQVANLAFGGQRFASLWNNPNWQFTARRGLLSPDWTTGRLLGASSMLMNLSNPKAMLAGAGAGTLAELMDAGFEWDELTGFGAVGGAAGGLAMKTWASRMAARMHVPGDIMAKEARRMYGAALVGGLFFSHMLNHAFTGHFMWDNPEGKKLKIALPGSEKFVSLGKAYKEWLEFMGAIDRDKNAIPVLSRTVTKLAPIPRTVLSVAGQRDYFGNPIVDADSGLLEAGGDVAVWAVGQFTPIFLSGPIRAGTRIATGTNVDVSAEIAGGLTRAAGFTINSTRPKRSVADELQALLGPVERPPLPGASHNLFESQIP